MNDASIRVQYFRKDKPMLDLYRYMTELNISPKKKTNKSQWSPKIITVYRFLSNGNMPFVGSLDRKSRKSVRLTFVTRASRFDWTYAESSIKAQNRAGQVHSHPNKNFSRKLDANFFFCGIFTKEPTLFKWSLQCFHRALYWCKE